MGDDTGEDLPTYYPEIGDDVRKGIVIYNDVIRNISYGKKSLTYFLTYGAKAIKDVFIFERSLNISDKPLLQSIVFDRQRLKVKNAFRFFKISMVVFEKAVEVLEAAEPVADDSDAQCRKKLVLFIEKCLAISKSAYNWISYFHTEETDVIRNTIKDPSADIHMIEWYDKQVMTEISKYYSSESPSNNPSSSSSSSSSSNSSLSSSSEKKPILLKKDAAPLKKLYDMIEQEIMYRSKAEQVLAVRHLKKLSDKIFGIIQMPTTLSVTAAAPPPEVIIEAFQKRCKELENAIGRFEKINLIASGDDGDEKVEEGQEKEKDEDGLESVVINDDDQSFLTAAEREGDLVVVRNEVYDKIVQLLSDVVAFRNEIETSTYSQDVIAKLKVTTGDIIRKVKMFKETLISIPVEDTNFSDDDSLIKLDKVKRSF